ncbi:hypothetical protein TorRG33x02_239470 [Trema orientale]|uniref:Uncharacterized protein n=1 Tax=Trema orientale TaxID=63057 RepID=A0A2P5DX25_TREOI|nr:hypothetical protein TorRG33x02_239470 [Trema orientale]
MCVCCPTLRSSSQKPVKRYKKLLAEIFPKSIDVPLSERKIVKLCEYAARNPIRIPKENVVLQVVEKLRGQIVIDGAEVKCSCAWELETYNSFIDVLVKECC